MNLYILYLYHRLKRQYEILPKSTKSLALIMRLAVHLALIATLLAKHVFMVYFVYGVFLFFPKIFIGGALRLAMKSSTTSMFAINHLNDNKNLLLIYLAPARALSLL